MGHKITFIGAGSLGFTRGLVNDILTFPAFADATLCLMDIDAARLDMIRRTVQSQVDRSGLPIKVEATMDRRAALAGAKGVLCTILHGTIEQLRRDIDIPKKYGVDFCVGDTRGAAGIFRALRTVPVMIDILRDVAELCPEAIFLNYTNPMAMLCRAAQGAFPGLQVTGLCHSVQGTAAEIAGWIGADMADVQYTCAGLNHMAFYTKYTVKGQDAYPLLRQAAQKPEVREQDLVRFALFDLLGYFPTESSAHSSEYYPWFRPKPAVLADFLARDRRERKATTGRNIVKYLARETTWQAEEEQRIAKGIDLHPRGQEYAANILNACFGDHTPFAFNGNLRNHSLISNLPAGACVEVPALADRSGVRGIPVPPLPAQLAALCTPAALCEELAVHAALTGDREALHQAIALDPNTNAVLGLDDTRRMVEEMLAVNVDLLPQF